MRSRARRHIAKPSMSLVDWLVALPAVVLSFWILFAGGAAALNAPPWVLFGILTYVLIALTWAGFRWYNIRRSRAKQHNHGTRPDPTARIGSEDLKTGQMDSSEGSQAGTSRAPRLRRLSAGLFALIGLYYFTMILLAVLWISIPAWVSAVVIVGLGTAAFTARSRSTSVADEPAAGD